MFDFPAWMDEVHIVEMGRNILDGGSCSILMQPDGSIVRPFYYLGPVLQELCFRAFGVFGPRLSSLLGLFAMTAAFHWFLRKSERYAKHSIALSCLIALSLPLLIQSVRQVRVDCWVLAAGFLIGGLLVRNRIHAAAAVAAITPFLWPSAILLFPFYLAVHFERKGKVKELLTPAIVFFFVLAICTLPILSILTETISAFVGYYTGVGHSAVGTSTFSFAHLAQSNLVLLTKEGLRAPFFSLLALIGLGLSFRQRKILVAMFILSWILALASGMHTFRFIYLTPFLLVFATETITRKVKCASAIAHLAIMTGCIGFWTVLRPHTPANPNLAHLQGEAPHTVFCPGYSTYYALRQQGHQQIAIGDASGYADTNRVAKLLGKCDAVLIEHEDKYVPIEESLTFYGLLRNHCLSAARQESGQPQKSIPARIGEAFAYGVRPDTSEPIVASGFTLRMSDGRFLSYAKPTNLQRKPSAPAQSAE